MDSKDKPRRAAPALQRHPRRHVARRAAAVHSVRGGALRAPSLRAVSRPCRSDGTLAGGGARPLDVCRGPRTRRCVRTRMVVRARLAPAGADAPADASETRDGLMGDRGRRMERPGGSLERDLRGRVAEVKPDEPRPGAVEHHDESERGSIGTAILGAGPAGLTAAQVFARRGRAAAVFEADGAVGGIAKTVEFNGYRFDLGGHRFFTKLEPIERLWEEMLGEEFLLRPRLSRIYYHGKYFSYPITAKDVLARLGVLESVRCALSYLWAARRPKGEAQTFEEWVTARFGQRLYDVFFRSYTEKVWGIPGTEIRALWAAQRIKNFSLGK